MVKEILEKEIQISKERFREILTAVDVLRPIAKRYQATPAQLVLAWYMKNPRVSVVIPGAKVQSKYLTMSKL